MIVNFVGKRFENINLVNNFNTTFGFIMLQENLLYNIKNLVLVFKDCHLKLGHET